MTQVQVVVGKELNGEGRNSYNIPLLSCQISKWVPVLLFHFRMHGTGLEKNQGENTLLPAIPSGGAAQELIRTGCGLQEEPAA